MNRSTTVVGSLCAAVMLSAALSGCGSGTTTAASSSAASAAATPTTATTTAATPASSPATVVSVAGASSVAPATPAPTSSTSSGTTSSMDMGGATGTTSSSTSSAGGTAVDLKAACAALVKIDAVPQPDSEGDAPPTAAATKAFGTAVKPLLAQATAAGGPTLAKILRPLEAPVAAAIAKGTPIDPDKVKAVGAALVGYETWANKSCGFQKIDVMAMDYKYSGEPNTVKAGVVSVLLANHSKKGEFHLAMMVQPKDHKKTTVAALLKIPVQKLESSIDILGAAAAGPGQSGGALLTLKPGQYFMVCPVAVGGKENSTDLHMFHGMAVEIDVV